MKDVYYHALYSDGSLSAISSPTRELWRYMDLWKLVAMLRNEAVYFPVLASLSDELEAAEPRLPEHCNNIDQSLRWRRWNRLRCTAFVSCWHCSPIESAAMWAIYAGKNQGLALRTTLDAFCAAFRRAEGDEGPANRLRGDFVRYVSPEVEGPPPASVDEADLVLSKRSWYRYEEEVRAFCINDRNWIEPERAYEAGAYREAGLWARCDLRILVKRIVVSPHSPADMEYVVREVLHRFGFDPDLVVPSQMTETVMSPNPTLVRNEWISRSKGSEP
jgi:hypothetical protein